MGSDSIGVVSVAAFGREIAMLVALAVGGWALSTHRLPDPARFIAQATLFAASGALLAFTHRPWWGVTFAVVAIAVFALSRRFA